MTTRDVEILRSRLAAIVRAAGVIGTHAEDVHLLAYEHPVGAGDKVSGGEAVELDDVGNVRARYLWRRLMKDVRAIETLIVALERGTGNLLSKGAGVEETRGSLIHRREFREALRSQRRRADRDEYAPTRMVDQPPYPGTGTP